MKTRSFAVLLMASIAMVLLGCSDNANSVVSPVDQVIPTPPSLAKPIVHSVQGGCWWGGFGNGRHVQNTITAHEYSDGTFGGMYMINCANAFGHDRSQKWNARVIFLKVYTDVPGYDKFAVVGGVETTGPYAGVFEVWFLIDSGPGSSDLTADHFFWSEDSLAVAEEWNKTPAELIAEIGVSPPPDGGNITIR